MKLIRLLTAILPLAFLTWGCYYDDEETLYPQTACDTSNITYSLTVNPVLQSNCSQCHNSVSPSGGIDLASYDAVVAAVNTGRVLGAINHETGYSPMPKNADKLGDCQIAQVTKWIDLGMPNN
jgi:hypothetical protein